MIGSLIILILPQNKIDVNMIDPNSECLHISIIDFRLYFDNLYHRNVGVDVLSGSLVIDRQQFRMFFQKHSIFESDTGHIMESVF